LNMRTILPPTVSRLPAWTALPVAYGHVGKSYRTYSNTTRDTDTFVIYYCHLRAQHATTQVVTACVTPSPPAYVRITAAKPPLAAYWGDFFPLGAQRRQCTTRSERGAARYHKIRCT